MPRPNRTGVRGLIVDAAGRRAIDLRYTDSAGIPRRYKERLPPGTPARAAELRARQVLSDALLGKLVPRGAATAISFRAAWDAYLTWVAINRVKAYRQRTHIARTWVRVVGNVPAAAVDGAACERFKAVRVAEGAAPATVNKALRTLRHLAGLSAKGAITAGISREQAVALRDAPLLREPPGRQRPVTPDELAGLMAAFAVRGDSRFARRVVLASLLTGMRLGEVLTLTFADVHDGTINLARTKQNRNHQIPASAAFLALVEEARADHPGGPAATVVFPNRLGNAYTPDGFSKHFARVAERAGIPDLTFHDLRRHVGTVLVNAGERLEVVSRLLGHSTVAVTQRSYAHLATEATRASVDVLAASLGPSPEEARERIAHAKRERAEMMRPKGVAGVAPTVTPLRPRKRTPRGESGT